MRPPTHYYIASEMRGQCNSDLYELARKTGSFSEAQIGQIAFQLLTQLKELHNTDLFVLLLTPQNVLVRSESGTEPILIDIANVIPMMVAQMKNPNGFSYITGVDRIFLAPELNLSDVGPYNDVWSVGAILYLLITGGRSSRRPMEKFEFKEEVWSTVSKKLKNFLTDMLQI